MMGTRPCMGDTRQLLHLSLATRANQNLAHLHMALLNNPKIVPCSDLQQRGGHAATALWTFLPFLPGNDSHDAWCQALVKAV
jgi:hypothetical protein